MGGGLCPHQTGAIVGEGQYGEGATRQEVFVGHALVGVLQPHSGHHTHLAIVPGRDANARRLPDDRAAAFGADHQGGAQQPAILQSDFRSVVLQLYSRHPGRGQDRNLLAQDLGRQGGAGPPVFQEIAQGLAL